LDRATAAFHQCCQGLWLTTTALCSPTRAVRMCISWAALGAFSIKLAHAS
jgi:hypothetical protein